MIGNAIGTFFQRKKGKGVGPLPPIPDLEGVIGLYIAKGLTNDSMKENPVWKDKSGLGNDFQMKNFSWSVESGCGLYPINMPADLSVDQPFGTLHFTTSTNYNYTVRFVEASPITIRFKISGLTEGLDKGLYIRANIPGSGTVDTKAYNTNGIHEYSYENETAFSVIFYNGAGNAINFSDFYVEVIPDYEGYLVTDGVDDTLRCKNFNLGKDFTVIGDWALLNTSLTNAGLSLHPQIHVFNNVSDGVNVSFRGLNTRLSVKSLKAICSDGRCYDDDWNDLNIKVGDVISSDMANLFIGNNDTNYTKIAFKNLAIYNGKVLTKDQCIAGYNLLQTFKNS